MTAKAIAPVHELVAELAGILGTEHVLTDPKLLELYSVDFSERRLATAAVIARPGSTEDVRAIVRLANERGVPLVPRGASMSYTLGTVPQRPGSIVVDMQRMNRILRIDTADLYVLVEPGVTWAELHEALAESEYATPFIGTFSGIRATIGGGLGNWATGWGRGDVTDALLGVEVVLPDGRLLRTGALSVNAEHPGLTCHGPDLTRLFVNDAGAFGIRTRVALRLERKPGGTAYGSWGFECEDDALAFLVEVARLGVAAECFAFSRYHHEVFADRPPPPAPLLKAMLRRIVRDSGGTLNAARNLLTLARTGRLGFLRRWPFSVHLAVDGVNRSAADASMRPVRRAARACRGRNLPGGFVMAARAQPFGPIDELMLGRDGEICFPSNCIVALSQGMAVKRALDEFFAARADYMKQHGLYVVRLYLAARNSFGIEPIIYWKDRMNPLRYSILGEERRRRFGETPDNPQARAAALALRDAMVREVFAPFHPAHAQIGKYYPYRDALAGSDAWSVLDDIKNAVDPRRLMNPGALGLD